MRLSEYVEPTQEQKRINKFIENVKKDCKPWLSAIKNCQRKILYRGYKGKLIDKKNVRTNRRPKDMPLHLHKKLDDVFFENFGWRPRSEGLFVSSHSSVGAIYGDTGGLVFPVGKFDFLWNKDVHDLYAFVQRDDNNKMSIGDYILEGYTNKNLCRAMASLKEIMIRCKSYYVISFIHLEKVLKDGPGDGWSNDLMIGEICSKWIEESFF